MRTIAAILLHFVGFYAIDSLMPEWVEMAGAWLLAKWYFGFVMVDVIAMTIAGRSCVNYVLAISTTWSALLAAEQMLLADQLQQVDGIVQTGIDSALLMYVTIMLLRMVGNRVGSNGRRTTK